MNNARSQGLFISDNTVKNNVQHLREASAHCDGSGMYASRRSCWISLRELSVAL